MERAMHEVRNANELVPLLRPSYQTSLSGVIGIDGGDGVGKTCLARTLQASTGGRGVSLDEFIIKNELGSYIPHLKKSELLEDLMVQVRPLIIEGVCLRAALAAVSVQAHTMIYVKQVLPYPPNEWYWHNEKIYDPERNIEELIRDLSPISSLKEEIIRYHEVFRPSRLADIAYLQFNR